MQLNRNGLEWYALEITTDPPVAAWEASFDAGATWKDSTTVGTDGWFRWLVAGPNVPDPGDAAVLQLGQSKPLIRAADNPEVVVRGAPSITVT